MMDLFIEAGMRALKEVQRENGTFTVDDLWPHMEDVEVEDKRAMGNVLLEAKAQGVIAATGTYRPSSQPQCHSNPRQVWRFV